MPRDPRLFIGLDLGTSGCRACAINSAGVPVGEHSIPVPKPEIDGTHHEQSPYSWWIITLNTLDNLLNKIDKKNIASIAVDATSSSVMLTNNQGEPLGPALMYNDARAQQQAKAIKAVAPPDCGAHGASSSLAKALWLINNQQSETISQILHQADWIAGCLSGSWNISDENNALKLGYDPVKRQWPGWLQQLGIEKAWLPRAYPPGTPCGSLSCAIARQLGLPDGVQIVTGTTDSIAGFIATGASLKGEAVTSLGSTLAIKIISDKAVFTPEYGIYSHRLGDLWLAGGASNSGGAVLQHYFEQAELDAMTALLRPEQPTGLDYYPLTHNGERFPSADPERAPRLEPRPDDPVQFFQGMLEGIANIEYLGYQRLAEHGAPYPTKIYTVGGGSNNPAWQQIRQNRLGVDVVRAQHTEAAFGAALLARQGILNATEFQ